MAIDASGQGPIDPDAILRQPFTTVRKGYDPLEVQKYLMALAGELRAGRTRERDLERRLADAQRRADELEHLSPQRLTEMLGEETAQVIEAANAASADIRTKAEENVARLLRDAQEQSGKLRREAEAVLARKTKEAEQAAEALGVQAEEALQKARTDAEAEAEAGMERGREMVAEAQRVRERVLRDLARRRKTLRQQIEQLQAGRERLLESYAIVRETVETATKELDVVLPEAKAAADAALARMSETDGTIEDELVTLTAEVDAAQGATVPPNDHAAGDSGPQVVADDQREEGTDGAPPDEAPPEVPAERHVASGFLPKAPDPATGRHSSAVNVIRGESSPIAHDHGPDDPEPGSAARMTDLFTRIKHEAMTDEEHGEAAARVARGSRPAPEPRSAAEVAEPSSLSEQWARVLAELERNLGRGLKRELSDEQNELLDAVRRDRTTRSVDDVLPPAEAHVERLVNAAFPALSDAATAGTVGLGVDDPETVAVPRVGSVGAGTSGVGALARDVAADLAADLVAPLRERLEASFRDASGEEDGLSEAVRTCYREWRTHRVDPAATHAVVDAFNRGVLAAADAGTRVRWLVPAGGPGCPDCGSNVLAAGVTAGEAFPSGHAAPPIHDGCQCVLVAEATGSAGGPADRSR